MADSIPGDVFKYKRRSVDTPPFAAVNPVLIGHSTLGRLLIKKCKGEGWGDWTIWENDAFLSQNIKNHERPKISNGFRINCNMKCFQSPEANKDQRVEKDGAPEKGGGKADLILDVTGTQAVRRELAGKNTARCGAIFYLPGGNVGVLLLEDQLRRLKLNQLEAQFFRRLISDAEQGVGDGLDFTINSRGGAPGILLDALVQQFLTYARDPDSAIIICRFDESAQKVTAHRVQPSPSLEQTVGDWRIVWDKELELGVMRMRMQALPGEMGSVILGGVDPKTKTISIVDFRPPPRVGDWSRSYFAEGALGASEAVQAAEIITQNKVSYVGDWHSHPDAILPIPNIEDLRRLAESRDIRGLTAHPPVILIIGEIDIRFHMLMEFAGNHPESEKNIGFQGNG